MTDSSQMQSDLTNCDREKIHLVGSIQPHGFFFAFRLSDKTIYHVSENAQQFLDRAVDQILGKRLSDIFNDSQAIPIIKAAELLETDPHQYIQIPSSKLASGFDVYIYDLDGLVGVEIEPKKILDLGEISAANLSQRKSRDFVQDIHTSKNLRSAGQLACKAIRAIIGFERVMLYHYLPNWDGEVIAEDKSAEAHSFLGHRFPASDIPLPARELYLKNRNRLIVSSSAAGVPITPVDHYLTRKPLDLSHSKLRAVSLIHLEYLRNMKVDSSFSVAIIVNNQLWGLIACHGTHATIIQQEVRLACESIAGTFAILASMIENVETQTKKIESDTKLKQLVQKLSSSSAIIPAFFQNYETVRDIFSISGVALITHERIDIAGLTPPDYFCRDVATWVATELARSKKKVVAVESLAEVNPEWAELKVLACGVLGFKSSAATDTIVLLFRPEFIRSIVWGGDPQKTMQKRNYQGVINPRNSFESWTEAVSGKSQRWESFEIQAAEFLKTLLFDSLLGTERLLTELSGKISK